MCQVYYKYQNCAYCRFTHVNSAIHLGEVISLPLASSSNWLILARFNISVNNKEPIFTKVLLTNLFNTYLNKQIYYSNYIFCTQAPLVYLITLDMGPYEWLSFLSFERYLSKYKKYMKLNISDFFSISSRKAHLFWW